MGTAQPVLSAAPFIIVLLAYPSIVSMLWSTRNTQFVVVEGCLEGVDLWTVENIRYGHHCVWLDKVCINGVPKPKVLLQSLEDYYIHTIGVNMP